MSEIGNVPDATADEMEMALISALGTRAPGGYNLTAGGGGRRGFKHTEETKAKIRAAWRPSEARHTERSAAARARMSAAQQRAAADRTQEWRAAARARSALSSAGRIPSEATKTKISAALKGRVFSVAERAKISAACRARWAAKRRQNSAGDS